jgi:hypothetical protein
MGLAPLGVIDLSVVTNTLISMLENYIATASPLQQALLASGSSFTINFSGAFPDAMRKDGGCQLTFTLFHVVEDKYQRNASGLSQRAQQIPFQPMGLDLYSLLTAYADQQYTQEQQAMSMALQFFYQTPIVRMAVAIPGVPAAVAEEFVLSMEMETSDELARLWQAITVPMRLSAVYKVSVVMLTPPAPLPLAKGVTTIQLAADPTLFPYALNGQVVGSVRTVSFASLASTIAKPIILSMDTSPAVAVPGPGSHFILYGANLNLPTSNNVYLTMPDGTEFNVTPWLVPEPTPGVQNFQTASRMTLQLPLAMGALPANAPPPGVYQLSAGSDAPTKYRTNATPFSVAAFIDTSSVPQPNPPILAAVAGVFTLNGQGFVTGATEVYLDTILLLPAGITVVSAAEVTFTAPAGIAAGTYGVRVRVNNVESPPSWWVVLP